MCACLMGAKVQQLFLEKARSRRDDSVTHRGRWTVGCKLEYAVTQSKFEQNHTVEPMKHAQANINMPATWFFI